ncbi:MAG: type II toxin-antitoxin system VapC family toxin [Planctomycetaceae bacterium]|nr:type II toxin-antitoxin system VapC family toxin [Planctomycetaceae bacterium]
MRFLLDTDHISVLEWQAGQEYDLLSARMAAHLPDDFAFSIVSFEEQTLGAHNYVARARTRENFIKGYELFELVRSIFCSSRVLPMDDAATDVLQNLKSMKLHVKAMDLRIAAIAISNKVTLLTRNMADFSRIPNLNTENWTI